MSSNEVHYAHAEADSARATISTPVGPITITSNGQSITHVEWRETDTNPVSLTAPACTLLAPALTTVILSSPKH